MPLEIDKFNMKGLKKDSDDLFISKMIEETYSFLPEYDTSKGASDLLTYFDKRGERDDHKMENFLLGKSVDYFEASYIGAIKCFRISLMGHAIDFPKNWSIFGSVYNAMSRKSDGVFWINFENDDYFLTEVLSPFVNYESDLALLVKDGKVYLVFSPVNQKEVHEYLDSLSGDNILRNAA